MSVFARTREVNYRRVGQINAEDAEYFAELERREAEEDAKKRETFSMLFRLFGYMAKEWMFYSIAFSFLLLYSLCKF